MALSDLRENVILTKIILTADGTNGCVRGDTWWWTILTSAIGVMQAV